LLIGVPLAFALCAGIVAVAIVLGSAGGSPRPDGSSGAAEDASAISARPLGRVSSAAFWHDEQSEDWKASLRVSCFGQNRHVSV
jgi:hypothetical protein